MNQSVLQPLQTVRKHGQNLVDQLVERLQTLIDTGALRVGERLPSTRELAAQLGVNRGVLLRAVRRLEESGRLRSRVGSGITVVRGFPDGSDTGAWQVRFSAAIDRLPAGETAGPASEGLFADLSRLAPDERFFPLDEFLKILAETLRRQRDLWQYASPLGLTHLRQRIAVRLSQAGLPWSADDILITSGAQQALDLLFRVFVDPGDAVAVESPTYPGAIPLLRLSGAEAVEIPVTPGGGRDLSALASRRLKLLYTMPEHHNPTGDSMDETTKRQLLAAALSAGAVVVEDIYELPRQPRLFLGALDRRRVVSVGSFSKDLAPGFRLGWIAADRSILRPVAAAKQATDLYTPLPLQAATAEMLALRLDERVRDRREAEISVRAELLGEAVGRFLPGILRRFGGGRATAWLELPPGVSGREVTRRALSRGVRVTAGAEFDPAGRDIAALRLSISRVDRAVISEAIARLARAIFETESRGDAAGTIPTV